MSLPLMLGLIALGVVLLWGGAEALVAGAAALARRFRVHPAVIGLTVVAMGTSLPELAVSLIAVFEGRPDIALGNVLGSNIANVALIAGAAALLAPLPVYSAALRLEWPFMFLGCWMAFLLARDGAVDRLEGAFFLLALVLFDLYIARLAMTPGQPLDSPAPPPVPPQPAEPAPHAVWVDIVAVVLGIGVVVVGGRVLVTGAVQLATWAGWTERVIGLTVVAVGTSLPELAASLVAARRGQSEMALANVIGSNIFNVLGILAAVALVRPIAVSPALLTDFWWMLAFCLALGPLMYGRRKIARIEGVILLSGYAVYLGLLLRG